MAKVRIYTRWLGPVADGDAPTLSEDTTEYDCVPDEVDTEEGLTPVDLAVQAIRERHYITGPYCASSYPGWGGPHTWFSAEPYEHPYEDKREEVTAHLDGWSDADAHEIWRRVTGAA